MCMFVCVCVCVCVCLPRLHDQVFGTAEYTTDGVTEKLKLFEIGSRETLRSQVTANLPMFTAPAGPGVLLVVRKGAGVSE